MGEGFDLPLPCLKNMPTLFSHLLYDVKPLFVSSFLSGSKAGSGLQSSFGKFVDMSFGLGLSLSVPFYSN